MAFQLSPGVEINEVDLTTIVPAVATTKAGMAGLFEWGPVGQRVTVASENALVSTFRKPTNQNFPYWFTAANYLAYGRDLQVVRVTDSTSKNATNTGAGYSILRNSEELPDKLPELEGQNVVFLARYPGALGNSLAVSISDKTDTQADQDDSGGTDPGDGGTDPGDDGTDPGGGGTTVTYTYETINRIFSRSAVENNANGPKGLAKFAVSGSSESWSDFDRVHVLPSETPNPPNTYAHEHHYVYLSKLPNTIIPPSTHGGQARELLDIALPQADGSDGKFPITVPQNFPVSIEGPLPKVSYDGKTISLINTTDAENAAEGSTGTIRALSHSEPFMLYMDIRELDAEKLDDLDPEAAYFNVPTWNGAIDNSTYNTGRQELYDALFHPIVPGINLRNSENTKRRQVFLCGDDGYWPENQASIETGGSVFNVGNGLGGNFVSSNGKYMTGWGPLDDPSNTRNPYTVASSGNPAAVGGPKSHVLNAAASIQYYVTNTVCGVKTSNPDQSNHAILAADFINTPSTSNQGKHPCLRADDGEHLQTSHHVLAFVSLITGIPDTGNFPQFYTDPDDPNTWDGTPTPELTTFTDFQQDSAFIKAPLENGVTPNRTSFANSNNTNWDYSESEFVQLFDQTPVFTGRIENMTKALDIAGKGAIPGPFGSNLFAFLPEKFESNGLFGAAPNGAGNNIGICKITNIFYHEGRPAMMSIPRETQVNIGGTDITFPRAQGHLPRGNIAGFATLLNGQPLADIGLYRPGEKTWISFTFAEGGYGLAKGDINYRYKMPLFSTQAGGGATKVTRPSTGEIVFAATRVNRLPMFFAGALHVDRTPDGGLVGVASDGDGRATIITATDNSSFAPPSSSFNAVNPDGSWRYSGLFDTQLPASSSFADRFNVSNDLMHMVVYDRTGDITGTVGTVLERFGSMSKAPNAKKFDGSNNFYKTIINENSKWVHIADTPGTTSSGVALNTIIDSSIADSTFASIGTKDYVLDGGTDIVPTGGDFYTNGYDQFADPQTVDISLILGGPLEGIQAKQLVEMCDARKDAVAFISPAKNAVLTSTGSPKSSSVATANVIAYRKGVNASSSGGDVDYSSNNVNVSSSYGFLDSGWKYMYDRYNDIFRFVPLNGDMGGLAARSDDVAEPWFSPAGFNRGQVRNVVKLAFNPVQTQRDNLYSSQVNSVCAFPGEGTVLFGDKTMQSKPSAFDRLNVRRLFIVIEKAIATASKFQLFEQNDAFTRASFRQLIEPFLRDVQSRRGIQDFKVVCDESNNTGEVIDRNEFVADIFIKPTRSINYITLNFVATRTDIDFDEIGGSV